MSLISGLPNSCMYKNGRGAGVGFDSFPGFFFTPTAAKAVIVSRCRIQSLITFIPSRAGLALPSGSLWDVGKSRMEKLKASVQCGEQKKKKNGPSVQTHTVETHPASTMIRQNTGNTKSGSLPDTYTLQKIIEFRRVDE